MEATEIIEIRPISEYAGMKGVTRVVTNCCSIIYYANFKTFRKEIHDVGGHSFRFSKDGILLEVLDINKNIIKQYRFGSGYQLKKEMSSEDYDKLFFYDCYFDMAAKWYRYFNNTVLSFPPAVKTFLNIRTFFDGTSYCVINEEGSYIIPPGKYAYIDGFSYGYARVFIKNTIIESENDSGYRCGIIDIHGNIILPIEYTFITPFFDKAKVEIEVWEGGYDMYGEWHVELNTYKYNVLSHKLKPVGNCFDGHYIEYTEEPTDNSSQYSIWDAFEGSEEAAASADFEW